MKDRGVSSSDIDRARELSRRLSAFGSKTRQPSEAAPAAAYVRFTAAVPSEATTIPSAVASPERTAIEPAVAELPPLENVDSWETLLTWVSKGLAADAAFVVDNQGFVIANTGKVPTDGFVALGAELCLSFEQLESMDPLAGRPLWLDLEFMRRRIVAFCARVPKREQMLFVAINPAAAYVEKRTAVEKAVLDCMSKLP
jgi:hypothetical protein